MFQICKQYKKLQIKRINIIILLFLPFQVFCQTDSLTAKGEPYVSISLDSAKLIEYNKNTTPLEVVIRNILGIIETEPSYLMEHTEITEFIAHERKFSLDSQNEFALEKDSLLFTDSASVSFQTILYLKTEFKDSYLFSDSLKFNYRWVRAGRGREAIITVNNDKIYFLRRVDDLWKIYVWTTIDFYDERTYERYNDN